MIVLNKPESEAVNSCLLTQKSQLYFPNLCKNVGLPDTWWLFNPASRDDVSFSSSHKSDSGIDTFWGYTRCSLKCLELSLSFSVFSFIKSSHTAELYHLNLFIIPLDQKLFQECWGKFNKCFGFVVDLNFDGGSKRENRCCLRNAEKRTTAAIPPSTMVSI